jgi:hypothetical protein
MHNKGESEVHFVGVLNSEKNQVFMCAGTEYTDVCTKINDIYCGLLYWHHVVW